MKQQLRFRFSILIAILAGQFLFTANSVRIQTENIGEKCDFAKCTPTDDTKLNVHLVPHTHDDVGWLKTVEQYYYGSKSDYQVAGVQYILDSVMRELLRNRERRFMYVEVAFFAKWWREQNDAMRANVRELVRAGQLEFVNGGWCMNDEATTRYSAIIDQMTLGLRFLNDTFGSCGTPRVAWQIDPFGHSREQASLFAQFNFDGVFFSRIDYEDRLYRRANRTLEHVWRASSDLGSKADLFTSIMNQGYGPPRGFNWDLPGGSDDPIIDDPDSEEYNVMEMVRKFVAVSLEYSSNYATNHILFPMGEDFNYQAANVWYRNMDRLIKHVNRLQSKIRVFYSTPSCYLKALYDSGTVFTAKSDDYFPYASDPNALWTGYFTSRPALKRMERVGDNWLQACKQLNVIASDGQRYEKQLRTLQEAMAVMQHHDAVAGTEKQHVAFDYAKQLQRGIDQCKQVIDSCLKRLIASEKTRQIFVNGNEYQFCDYLNISSCYASETYRNMVLTMYNPFGHSIRNHTVRLPITLNRYSIEVLDPERNSVMSTIFPIPEWIRAIPGRPGNATHELVFDVDISPLGFASYFVIRTDAPTDNSAVFAKPLQISTPIRINQRHLTLYFASNGALQKVKLPGKSANKLRNSFYYYEGHMGNNKIFMNRSSGAYIFRPIRKIPIPLGKILKSILYKDERRQLIEIHQRYDSLVQQTIRLHPDKPYIEFDWFVGSIPITDHVGKEVIVRYSSDLNTGRIFYTDSNGRQILKRKWNHRDSWNYTVFEPISGNYYPVNSRIFLRDQAADQQMTVLIDRSEGGTSAQDGEIELMLHRRLLHDDAFGVGEPLNETGTDGEGLQIRGRHLLLFADLNRSARLHREWSQRLNLQPILAIMGKFNIHQYSPLYRTVFSALQPQSSTSSWSLPDNVNILTLEKWRSNQILLRLEHLYQSNEDSVLSKAATVQLRNVLPANIDIVNVEELTLGANQKLNAMRQRLKFKYMKNFTTKIDKQFWPKSNSLRDEWKMSFNGTIRLEPMQIRTFVITTQ